jgi:carboxyl-terminal processing protease
MPAMTRFSFAASLLAAAAILVPSTGTTQRTPNVYDHISLYGVVFERVRADYVDKVEDKKLVEASINGMLQSLDPHSSYLNAESFKEMQVQTRGEFGGLGLEVTMERGVVKVVSPIDDTPAAKAGLQAGDYITHINGKPVAGLDLRQAVEQLRGPVGSSVTVKVRRGERDFDVTLQRAVIVIRSVRHRIEGDIGVLRITSFTEQTEAGVKAAIAEFRAKLGDKLQGVVLDLRNNPGGLLDQSVLVSDAFLDQGEIVSTRGRDGKVVARQNAKKGDLLDGLPIVVLINGGSASASEIVAGALQDHRRAIVMGTQSFGKGSVQTIIPLGSSGAMRLTTSRYYTPSGRSIQAKGIEPDIVVEQGEFKPAGNEGGTRERDLRGALDAPKDDEKKGEPKKDDSKAEEKKDGQPPAAAKPPQDFQMQRALDTIRAIGVYERSRSRKG